MKQFQSILLVVLTLALGVLYFLHFKTGAAPKKAGTPATNTSAAEPSPEQVRIAYIDLDTIKEYYTYFKLKNDEIDREKQRIENEIQGGVSKLEKDRMEFLKKGEAITQIEAENFQRDYQNRYQQLGVRRETLLNQHLNNQAKALDDIQKRINEYLKDYNQQAGYHFIFSTGEGNLTLYYKDSAYNITREVIAGLNEAYERTKKK
ncbi:MAG TPA: OmpH family outer membrane protein [Lacibacter sp.]|nr:OmpH family outer membrane protein [Lacibacter sp.]HMO87675.1 OmpH family outer membrane protein [Lacibacter sp.]HMP86564.1 OmpH family outer membrane protein [Lacibacter sp.]